MADMHTTGPWYFAADADGTMITDDTGAQIAIWPPQGGTVEQCKNARLMAAAPDMLRSLIRLTHPTTNDDDRAHALAIIARVTPTTYGEQL